MAGDFRASAARAVAIISSKLYCDVRLSIGLQGVSEGTYADD